MEPYQAPSRRRRYLRRWLITGTGLLLLVGLLAAVAAFGYLQLRLGQVKRVSPTGLVDSGKAMTVLLVGSDSRAGLAPGQESFGTAGTVSGQRSDAIMLLRTDPARKAASVLSIPRDLWIPIYGTGRSRRINSAYAGGPERLIKTIDTSLGIPIDHYVELNFDGFRGIVDAIGGLNVPFPAPARDVLAELDVPASGCVRLSGRQGLAYVRSRRFEVLQNGRWKVDPTGDLGRIQRQQEFIRRMVSRSIRRGTRNPVVAKKLLDSFVRDVTIDRGLGTLDLIRLGRTFRSLGSGGVQMLTLPTTGARIGGASVLRPKQPDSAQTIGQFLNPPPDQPEQGPVAPSKVRVRVLNGSGRAGEAGTAARILGQAGFALTGTGDAGSTGKAGSVIRYAPGMLAKASLLKGFVIGGAELRSDPTIKGSDLVLVTGRSFGGIRSTGGTAQPQAPAPNPVPAPAGGSTAQPQCPP